MKKLNRWYLLITAAFLVPFSIAAQTTHSKTEIIALVDYIALEAELTREHQTDSLLLAEIYNRLENHIDPGLLDANSRDQFGNLFNRITDFRIIDIRRERIKYIRDSARARAIQSAIPSPVFFLSLTRNIRDPLSLAINIAGMAAQSLTQYYSATEQADMEFYVENSKLTETQEQNVNKLRSGLFDYVAKTANANSLRDNDTVSRAAIEAFMGFKNESNWSKKVEDLERNQYVYEKFPPYWLELANTYCTGKRYSQCLSAIQKYESVNSPIFRRYCNPDYAAALANGLVALQNVYGNNPAAYVSHCLDFLQKIENNSPDTAWVLRYIAALGYLDLAATDAPGKKNAHLTRAYQLLRGNVSRLVEEQRKLRDDYLKPVEKPAKMDKQEKEVYKRLEVERKTAFPPLGDALITNFTALYGVIEQLGLSAAEKNGVMGIVADVFLVPKLRNMYFGEEPYTSVYNGDRKSGVSLKPLSNVGTAIKVGAVGGAIKGGGGGAVIGGVVGGVGAVIFDKVTSLQMNSPAIFLTPDTEIEVEIVDVNGSAVYARQKAGLEVKKVERPKTGTIADFKAEYHLALSSNIKLEKNTAYIARVYFATKYYTYTVQFLKPEKNSDFTEYCVVYD